MHYFVRAIGHTTIVVDDIEVELVMHKKKYLYPIPR